MSDIMGLLKKRAFNSTPWKKLLLPLQDKTKKKKIWITNSWEYTSENVFHRWTYENNLKLKREKSHFYSKKCEQISSRPWEHIHNIITMYMSLI